VSDISLTSAHLSLSLQQKGLGLICWGLSGAGCRYWCNFQFWEEWRREQNDSFLV